MYRAALSSLHDRWANLHFLVRGLILVVLLGGLGWLALKPGYRAFKHWRLERNLASAKEAVADLRMDEARDLSLTVLRAGDPRIDAFRILEQSTAALKDPLHGDIARALISHPQGTDDDRLRGFMAIAREAPLGVVGQAWVAMPEHCHKDPRFGVAFADRLIDEHRAGEAAAVLLAIARNKDDDAVQQRMVRLMIDSGKREGFDEAQRSIAARFPMADADLPAWLDLLDRIPALGLQENLLRPVRAALQAIAASDQQAEVPPVRAALALARMDYVAAYARRAELLETTIAAWKDRAPVDLAGFLNDLGLHQMLLDTFPAEAVAARPELVPQVLQAAVRTSAWERLQVLLDHHGDRLPRLEALAYMTLLKAKTSDATARSLAWDAAMAEAKGSSDVTAYMALQRIASESDLQDEAEQALIAAIRTRRGPLPLYADLRSFLVALTAKGRENILLEICAIYLAFEPTNPVLLTQYGYLACLNDLTEPARALEALAPMAKAFPKELPMQFVVAAVFLLDRQAAKAAELLGQLELLKQADFDPEKLPPSFRIVWLTTRRLTGQLAKDDPLLRDFPWQALLPSERKKFGELLRGVK